MRNVIKITQFIFLGLLTAAIGEWQFSVFLRNDLDNFIGSVVFNTLYMSGIYLVTRLLLTTLSNRPKFILFYVVLFGFTGLMVEWLLIGNSPWGNPDANQLGQFAYWACMALVPLMFLMGNHHLQTFIIRYALVYIALAVFGQFVIPSPDWRFAFHIYAVILGYLGLMVAILWKYLRPGSKT
ncbi:MAG: hypothetical protein L6461_10555 [Anaerolineae bacterium]|nr:hypothetical protein [Anaerolineae bacterium]